MSEWAIQAKGIADYGKTHLYVSEWTTQAKGNAGIEKNQMLERVTQAKGNAGLGKKKQNKQTLCVRMGD